MAVLRRSMIYLVDHSLRLEYMSVAKEGRLRHADSRTMSIGLHLRFIVYVSHKGDSMAWILAIGCRTGAASIFLDDWLVD